MTNNDRIKLRHLAEDSKMEKEGLNACLKTPEGRAFIRSLLARTGFKQSFTSNNAIEIAKQAGLQEFGNDLFDEIMALDPHSYGRLIEERMLIESVRAKELTPNEE